LGESQLEQGKESGGGGVNMVIVHYMYGNSILKLTKSH
jgi:hypothetical protein